MLFRPQTRRRAKPRHQLGIAEESLEPASEPFGVARRCQETGDAVLDQLRDAAHRRGHRRHAAGGRFHQADRHSFAVARKHRRCGPAPPSEDPGLLCRPSQLHGPGKIEPDPRSLEFVATRSVADDGALELYSASPEDRARLQEKLDPFEGNEPGDTHDQRRPRTASVRLEALRIHAAWNDVNAGRGHAEGLDDVPKMCATKSSRGSYTVRSSRPARATISWRTSSAGRRRDSMRTSTPRWRTSASSLAMNVSEIFGKTRST